MRRRGTVALTVIGTAVVVLGVILAAYAISRSPRDALPEGSRGPVVPAPAGDVAGYTLPSDRSAAQIGDDLEELGVIRSGEQFRLLVSLMGVEKKLSAGDYSLPRGISAVTAIQAITVKDSVPTRRVTFPEGIRIEEMAVIAEAAGFGTREEFLQAAAAAKLPADLLDGFPEGESLQGYLFPDTYILPIGSTPANLVDLMIKTFARRFTPEMRSAAAARGLSIHRIVTMAAIVEREAVLEAERPLIAGVFYNRLAAGDILGADPTTQFALTVTDPTSVAVNGWWKKELTQVDLDTNSPYNTRRVAGLPPGPITNPGLASLEAALNPTETTLYFFVADAKKADGSHRFAETQAEHDRNIAEVGQP